MVTFVHIKFLVTFVSMAKLMENPYGIEAKFEHADKQRPSITICDEGFTFL